MSLDSPQWWQWRSRRDAKGALPVPHNYCCSSKHRSVRVIKPKQNGGAVPEPWPNSSSFSVHQQHTMAISGLGLKAQ